MLQTKPPAPSGARRLSHLHRDRGYRFSTRDPLLEEICRLITNSGMTTFEISQKAKRAAGGACTLTPSTLNNWLSGKTKKPQNFTITWTLYALGYTRKLVKL